MTPQEAVTAVPVVLLAAASAYLVWCLVDDG